jgi:hypothetical protein
VLPTHVVVDDEIRPQELVDLALLELSHNGIVPARSWTRIPRPTALGLHTLARPALYVGALPDAAPANIRHGTRKTLLLGEAISLLLGHADHFGDPRDRDELWHVLIVETMRDSPPSLCYLAEPRAKVR